MSPRGSRQRFLMALLGGVLLAGCGSGPESRQTRTAGIPEKPEEGMIVFYDPNLPSDRTKRPGPPVLQIFTTSNDEKLAQDLPVYTYTGTVEGARRGEPVPNQAIERMLRRTQAGKPRLLSPEKFQELWKRLDEAGLFQLPASRQGKLPRNEPYILVEHRKVTWVFTIPKLEPGVKQFEAWKRSKLAILAFMETQ